MTGQHGKADLLLFPYLSHFSLGIHLFHPVRAELSTPVAQGGQRVARPVLHHLVLVSVRGPHQRGETVRGQREGEQGGGIVGEVPQRPDGDPLLLLFLGVHEGEAQRLQDPLLIGQGLSTAFVRGYVLEGVEGGEASFGVGGAEAGLEGGKDGVGGAVGEVFGVGGEAGEVGQGGDGPGVEGEVEEGGSDGEGEEEVGVEGDLAGIFLLFEEEEEEGVDVPATGLLHGFVVGTVLVEISHSYFHIFGVGVFGIDLGSFVM
mmetsp:Transcript_788/g.1595  ORF Transcript_788/g.1595 Transcript_788/m.1595 type:complete len:260 (-) Transcript_788:684-1463(-)